MKPPRAHVTDHALLRYLERVEGVDVAAARRAIERAVQPALYHDGCCGIQVQGFSYKLRGHIVTTVFQTHNPPRDLD